MIVKNLTNLQQKITVRELTGERREYDLYLVPNGVTDIGLMTIVSEIDDCILEIDGLQKDITPVVPVEVPKHEEISEDTEKEESVDEESTETPQETPEGDSFVCELCGAEFASARGLATHKNKVHND